MTEGGYYYYLRTEHLLFNTATFHLYDGDNKLIFNEMMMMTNFYYTNTLS
jgi:hypothetical protein